VNEKWLHPWHQHRRAQRPATVLDSKEFDHHPQ
jgi:hypothetical protein